MAYQPNPAPQGQSMAGQTYQNLHAGHFWDERLQDYYVYHEQSDTLIYRHGLIVPRPHHVPKNYYQSSAPSQLSRPFMARPLIPPSQQPMLSLPRSSPEPPVLSPTRTDRSRNDLPRYRDTYQAPRRDRTPPRRYPARSRSPYRRARSLERVHDSMPMSPSGSRHSSLSRRRDNTPLVTANSILPPINDASGGYDSHEDYRIIRRKERNIRPIVISRPRSPPVRDASIVDAERVQWDHSDWKRRETRDYRKVERRRSRDSSVGSVRRLEEQHEKAEFDKKIRERDERNYSKAAGKERDQARTTIYEAEVIRREDHLRLEKSKKEAEQREYQRMQQEKEKKEKKRLEMKKKEDAKKSTTNDPPNDMWTQITKDLVSKEAIEAKGYLYSEEKDSFYVHKYLPYHDVSELADMTAQIKAGQLLHHERSSEVNQKILSSNEPARPQVVEVKVDPIEGVSLSVAPSSTRLEEHDLALETALWEDTQSRKSQTPDFHTVKPRDRPKSSQRPRSGGNNVLSWLGGKNYREKKDFERPSAASQSGGISPLPKVNTHDSSERSQLDKRIKSSGQDITASRSKPFPPMAEEAHSLSSSNLMMANTSPPAPTPPRETRVETSKRGRPEASRSDAATYDAGKAARNKNSISPINRKNLDPSVETLWSRKDQNLPTIDDFDEIDALIDPISYFAELDQLEIDVAEKCHLKAIFPQALPHLRNIDKGAGLYSNSQEITIASGDIVRDHCRTVLYGILAALELMKLQGFCGESIEILVEDADRSNVTRVVDISIAQVLELRRVIELEANDTLALTKEFTFGILALFGARTRLSTYSETGSNDSSVGEVVSLLCSLLALATVSYAGSHCHDIGQIVWSSSLDYITFDNAYTRSGKNLQFYRRPLACLKDFVGGPVWVFGSRDSTESLLSTTITQFSDLWGPLIAIPSNEGFKELLMIQSEAGVLFQTKDSALARSQAKDEVLIHWISCEPPRKARKLLDKIKISSKKGEKLPTKLIPFSANARLLIGHPPPPSGASCTVTSNTPGLSLNTQGGIRVNNFCQFDLDRFQLENEANLHLIGTWDESYVPDQLQLALTAGQYVNVGIQKVWKRRPGCTQKARLLLALSNPRIRPTNLEKILQLSIGYEQSACTGNAKRVTLQQSLLGAYPSVAPLIERACDNHDAPYLLEFIVELSFTGLDANGHLSLFWPFNDGQDALELTDSKPTWKDFLKDTRDESCFAFISPRCLTYTGSDELKSRRIRMLCSCRHGNSDRPVFQTAIELDPKAKVRLPLEIEARIRLADGFLEIRNDDAVQLAAYGRRGLLSRLEELAICARDGQMGHQHRESMTAGIRPSRNTVPVCIVDR